MLTKLFLPLLFLGATSAATAQPGCAVPAIKLLRDNVEVPATGSALFPSVTLRVIPDAGCPAQGNFRFRNAELTLVRHGRPLLPNMLVNQPQVDLRSLLSMYQPGDHLVVFIAYENLAIVGADGKLKPYLQTKPVKPKPGHLDLLTDEAKGISFNWPLVKP
ncbi:hypothetical protein [Hymenobacter sp.]|jgi:hypothetical protein|uniref:hypothetical protein n=1 Tax=Hymenobacter sp. TaxID=1898978 RepID=UPI002ED829D2